MGSKKAPFYRVVVSESSIRPTGRFVDVLGTYDPSTDPVTVSAYLRKNASYGSHTDPTIMLTGRAWFANSASASTKDKNGCIIVTQWGGCTARLILLQRSREVNLSDSTK